MLSFKAIKVLCALNRKSVAIRPDRITAGAFWRLSYLCASLFFGRVIGFTGAVLLCPQKELRLGSGREAGIERVAASAISPSIKPKARSAHRLPPSCPCIQYRRLCDPAEGHGATFSRQTQLFRGRFYRSEVCSKNLRSCI